MQRKLEADLQGGQGRFPLLERAMKDEEVKYSQVGWRGGGHRETGWGRVEADLESVGCMRASLPLPERI